MGLAKLVDAPVLLAGDIDRGGVFAQLYGTVELLEPEERARIRGLIINKFRGRRGNSAPGPCRCWKKRRGLPVLGVVPYLKVDIEDEDSLSQRLDAKDSRETAGYRRHPAAPASPISPILSRWSSTRLLGVRYVDRAREPAARRTCIILPGTKNTMDDLLWLRQCGLEAAILKLAAGGHAGAGRLRRLPDAGPAALDDSADTESGRTPDPAGPGTAAHLPRSSPPEKRRTQVRATAAAGPFAGAALTGYEIHTGRTVVDGEPF